MPLAPSGFQHRPDPHGRIRSVIALPARCGILLTPVILTACQPAVLDPQGAIGEADKTILLNSLAIMLAIVVPTIAATLGFAWWYRSSNTRARYLPEFVYSGQLELITWAIPLLTIMLLGGVAWVGSHELDPAKPLVSKDPLNVQVVSLDWKWLFIYPDQHVASVNRLVIPAGVPVHFALSSGSVMNAFFIPQLGSMIYTMNGMRTRLNLIANKPGTFAGLSSHYSGDGFSTMHFDVEALPAGRFSDWVNATRGSGPTLTGQSYEDLAKQSLSVAPFTYRDVEPELFQKIVTQAVAAWPRAEPQRPTRARPNERGSRMFGKLTWAAIPFDQPIPLFAGAIVGFGIFCVLVYVALKGWVPYLWNEWITSVDHKRIGVMYIFLAMVMLVRGFIDALMMRSQQALAYKSPGFLPPEHYDQIFSAHGTLMIFFVAMAFVIGLMNVVVPLQLGARDVAFPTLNSVSFWLTATGALLINISLVVGEFARTTWLPYPPCRS